jgi:hypothetical protein
MITFHNDKLVPTELCRLLYQTIPDEYHVPVVFNNGEHRRGVLGTACSDHIIINLHPIFGGWGGFAGSMAARLWHETLRVCYHEFGHVATATLHDHVSGYEYSLRQEGYRYVEKLANDWANQRLAYLLCKDSRLGQPAVLTGYMGAWWWRWLGKVGKDSGRGCMGDSSKVAFVKEIRCLRSGGQFTIGDALYKCGFYPSQYRNIYRRLHSVVGDLGVVHTDAAGRKHRLFTHGDLPILQERLEMLHMDVHPSDTLQLSALDHDHPGEVLDWPGDNVVDENGNILGTICDNPDDLPEKLAVFVEQEMEAMVASLSGEHDAA